MQTELRNSPTATVAEDTQPLLHIDLLRQGNAHASKYGRFAAPLGITVTALLLVLLYFNFTWLNLGISLFVLLQVYNLCCSLTGKQPFGFMRGAAYFTLSHKGIVYKQSGQKSITIDWAEVDSLSVNSTTAEFNLKNDGCITIPLHELTDENLQRVNNRLFQAKQQWGI